MAVSEGAGLAVAVGGNGVGTSRTAAILKAFGAAVDRGANRASTVASTLAAMVASACTVAGDVGAGNAVRTAVRTMAAISGVGSGITAIGEGFEVCPQDARNNRADVVKTHNAVARIGSPLVAKGTVPVTEPGRKPRTLDHSEIMGTWNPAFRANPRT